FTLLEVVLVTAIIALLAAILLPSLSQAREQARRTECGANLKSLAFAWHTYLDANTGHFLQSTNANSTYGGKQGSGSSLYRWPKARHPLNRQFGFDARANSGTEIFHCPCDSGTVATSGITSYSYL